ncbi:glycosyltransferase family 2 protein [Mammaliicoccus sciuri]|uniref:glycosyltransferase family 2 protein n=1 Tax=Mammaliicoccus sciuri TaxID=1296 RepID=UPI002DBA2ACB|nr:glycosyltransferase family 2 protein [Mammaliicoccus sciuri]MEB6206288.1 glycosyltransferase family 2 protein [Mammaliicoccus sciuri]
MEEYLDVTVIIPYFRASKTILRALESIENQTKLPKEIIIIDDFSNNIEDENQLEFISKNYKVKIVRLKTNQGPGSARNRGIDIASGKYIAFLDSDDSWHREKLEIQSKIMDNSGAYISTHHSSIYGKNEKNSYHIKEISLYQQLLKNRFSTRTVMMRNNDSFRFEEGKRYSEDNLLWTQVLFNKKYAIYIDKTLANSYKEDFGDGGLTAELKKMYYGNLDSINILRRQGYIQYPTSHILKIYHSVKYIIRISRSKKRIIKNVFNK